MIEEYKKLIYRRQFYLTPSPVVLKGLFNHTLINKKYHLYCHQDLNLSHCRLEEKELYLLGDIYNPDNPEDTNDDILKKLIHFEFLQLVSKTNIYSGRYVILYRDGNNMLMFNDPATSRKVYYTYTDKEVWCGSQPHLIAGMLKIPETTDEEKLFYFKSDYFSRSKFTGIFQYTIYDEIFQLSPNHFLDFSTGQRTRFWPCEPIKPMPVDLVARQAGNLITGFLNAIYYRKKKLMLPVTAGMDSRLLLAASRNISRNVFYYINSTGSLKNANTDIKIGKKIVESLGLEYHILHPEGDVDEKFKEIYLKNTAYPYECRLPLIYNVYYKKFPEYYNLPGNFSEVGRNAWNFYRKKITGKDLLNLSWAGDFKYSMNKTIEWLSNVEESCKRNNVNILDLHYWENRMSVWGTHYQASKDIAQDETLPLNSRQLMITLFSVTRRYRDENLCLLHRKIVGYLWKDTLRFPVNPGFRKYFLIAVKFMGIYNFVYMVRHLLKLQYRRINKMK